MVAVCDVDDSHAEAAAKQFTKKGKVPDRFLIYGILGFGGRGFADPAVEKLAVALGDNVGTASQRGKKRQLAAHWPDPGIEAIKKQETARKGGFSDLLIVSYGDEIHLPPIAVSDVEFKAYLEELYRDRLANPRDDMMSWLMEVQRSDSSLTPLMLSWVTI